MPVRIGYFSDAPATDTISIRDVVRINISDLDEYQSQRAGRGTLISTRQSQKSDINIELDRLKDVDLSKIRNILHNRVNPHKFYANHPDDATQIKTFEPSADPDPNNLLYLASDNDNALIGSGAVEISGAEYTDFANFSGGLYSKTSALKFQYLFAEVDTAAFGSAVSLEVLQRIGIAFAGIEFKETGGTEQIGFKVDVKIPASSNFIEIYRQGNNVSNVLPHVANLRPIDGFTSFSKIILSDIVGFRIRNLIQKPVTWTSMDFNANWMRALLNVWGVAYNGVDNFTFRNSFTGSGNTGSLNFEEL